jgi:hypothetical protein
MLALGFALTTQRKKEKFAKLVGLCATIVTNLLFVLYIPISATVFATFLFDEFPDNVFDKSPLKMLKGHPTIEFDTDHSHAMQWYAVGMMLVYPIGVIMLFWYAISFSRKVIARNKKNQTSAGPVAQSVADSVSFLFTPYKFVYFECTELLRKLMLTSGILLIENKLSLEAAQTVFVWITMAFSFFFSYAKPYSIKTDLLLACVSMLLLFFLGTIPFLQDAASTDDSKETIANVMMITIGVVEFLALVVLVWVDISPGLLASSNAGKRIAQDGDDDVQNVVVSVLDDSDEKNRSIECA